MKPLFRKVSTPLEGPFILWHEVRSRFKNIWHFHPELELHYTIRGEGVRFIGDNISNFTHGDLVLVGENLPHTWRSSETYFDDTLDLNIEIIVLQFLPFCLGEHFLKLPEAHLISQLFEKAKSGLYITGKAKMEVIEILQNAPGASGLDSISVIFSILKILARTDEYDTVINGSPVFHQSTGQDASRLTEICDYTLSNYRKDISLNEIAALSNLTVTSFCRYFKLMTNKTYNNFLTEVRVSHACRALMEGKLPVEVICFDCGFNSLSNFYRHFKKVTGMTTRDYKRKYQN